MAIVPKTLVAVVATCLGCGSGGAVEISNQGAAGSASTPPALESTEAPSGEGGALVDAPPRAWAPGDAADSGTLLGVDPGEASARAAGDGGTDPGAEGVASDARVPTATDWNAELEGGTLAAGSDDTGDAAATADAVTPEPRLCPPRATTRIWIRANLDAQALTPVNSWDLACASSTSNFATTVGAFDDAGRFVVLDVFFRRESGESNSSWSSLLTWSYHVLLAGGPEYVDDGGGELIFDSDGALVAVASHRATQLPGADGGLGASVTFDFGSPTSLGGTGRDGITCFATTSNVLSQSQDGAGALLRDDCSVP